MKQNLSFNSRLFTLLLSVMMCVISYAEDTWTLVTDASTLKSGDIICFTSTGSYTASKKTYNYCVANIGKILVGKNNTPLIGQTDITITDGVITSGASSIEPVTLGGVAGAWTLHISDGYITCGGNNEVKFDNIPETVTIAIDAQSSNATIKFGSDSTLQYNPNSGTNGRFTIYKSVQKPIQIYRNSSTPSTYTASISGGLENGSIKKR